MASLEVSPKNNPNVIGLSEKLFKPVKRDLTLAHNFWTKYIEIHNDVNCIYSNLRVQNQVSIDHFVPWSYIAHDQIWNLLPTTKSVNSTKGNNLPNFEKYFDPFINLQFDAYQTIYKSEIKGKKQLLEDYANFFNSDLINIFELSKIQFYQKFEIVMKPMFQIAENMGFNSNWIYK